jgi:hypothetical protein
MKILTRSMVPGLSMYTYLRTVSASFTFWRPRIVDISGVLHTTQPFTF